MSEKPKRRLINTEISEDLYQRIKKRSAETGVSISFKIREAMEDWAWERPVEPTAKVEADFDFGA